MKIHLTPKLPVLAILSTMFIVLSFGKAEVKVDQVVTKNQPRVAAKTSTAKEQNERWIWWRNPLDRALAGKGSPLLPGNSGC